MAAGLAVQPTWGCGAGDDDSPAASDNGSVPQTASSTVDNAVSKTTRPLPGLPAAAVPGTEGLPVLDSITLLDSGTGKSGTGKSGNKKARLRYSFSNQRATRVYIKARLHSRELVNAVEQHDLDVPLMQYGIAIASATPSKGKTGTTRFELVGEIAKIEDQGEGREIASELMTTYRARLERKRMWVDVDSRGRVTDAGTHSPTGAATVGSDASTVTEIERMFLEHAVPLPEESISIGARWRTVARLIRAGTVVKQITTYELLELSDTADTAKKGGRRARVRVHAKQVGERQLVPSPGLPEDVTAELLAFVWEVNGDVSIDLSANPLATGELEIDQRIHGRLRRGPSLTETYAATNGTLEVSSQ